MLFVSPIAFAAGAMTWSFAEYGLHRFAGHAPRQRAQGEKPGLFSGDFGNEHGRHHTDTRYFTPTRRKVKTAAVVLGAVSVAGSFLFGPRRTLSYVAGFAAAYTGYEVLHRRTHTHAPWGPYSRWARKHHLAHHFKNPKLNHGVTSPIWDLVFGTYVDPGKVRVPRRHAPSWLCDESGEVKPEYREDYELGAAKPNSQTAMHV